MLVFFVLSTLACSGGEVKDLVSDPPPTAKQQASQTELSSPATKKNDKSKLYSGVFANDPLLSPLELIQRDPKSFPFLRNEIFARHGRAFKTPKYAEHFAQQAWYRINPNYSDSLLTANDQANIKLIRSFEGTNGAEKALNGGEYFHAQSNGESLRLVFFDPQQLQIIKGDDMYFNETEEYRWHAMGERWIVTWQHADSWSPKNKNASLWELDHNQNAVIAKYSIRAKM
ncbi:MAG: YARHG domain-containing protein [Myxococcota bacterium]|nr:YARHG domain-containing protein [Myxococcota bacterium]